MRWLALVVLVAGCASEWAPVGPMLLEARGNSLAATQRYQSKELKLTGAVVSTGKKKSEQDLVARTDARWAEARGADADAEYPFVQLRDAEHPSSDYVTCYLDRSDATPQLDKGSSVHVDGFFVQYVTAGGHVEAVLNRCSATAVPK